MLLRYFKILSDGDVSHILQAALGLSPISLYRLGMGFVGHFLDRINFNGPYTPGDIGVTQNDLDVVVKVFSSSLGDLQEKISRHQSYDQNYAYNFNPLRAKPLIEVIDENRRVLLSPMPTLLLWRFTEGVYYDICNQPGFDAAFGRSFQSYVGEVFLAANKSDKFEVLAEHSFNVGKNRKDSIDWIISGVDADIFIESKTKKLRLDSKLSLAADGDISADLDKMAGFVLQGYRTIADALKGSYPHWKPRNLPIFLVIQTLEDWRVFGGRQAEEIDSRVRRDFEAEGIDNSLLERIPYFIAGSADMEIAAQVIDQVGVRSFMESWHQNRSKMWGLHVFMMHVYAEELRHVGELFPDDMAKIRPEVDKE